MNAGDIEPIISVKGETFTLSLFTDWLLRYRPATVYLSNRLFYRLQEMVSSDCRHNSGTRFEYVMLMGTKCLPKSPILETNGVIDASSGYSPKWVEENNV